MYTCNIEGVVITHDSGGEGQVGIAIMIPGGGELCGEGDQAFQL